MDISRHDAGAPPARTHTAATLYHLFREACRCGMSPRELHSTTGIAPESLSDFNRRVSAEQLFHAWEQVMRRLREPELPVRVARRTAGDPRSPLTHLAMASSTVRQALERAVRFGAAFTTVYAIHLEPWPDGVAVVIDGLGTARLGERCEAEFELADFVATGRAAVGRVVLPQRVTFAHRSPRAVGLHRRHFGAGLGFGGPRTELVISAAMLSLPMRAPRPGLAAYLEASLQRSGAPAPASFTLRARAALAGGMADGELTIDHVARELHLSARTLHRRLAEEGTAFRRVLDETRHSRALALLGRPELPTAAVAEQLGFSSTRSFDRAFSRWTGTSPRGRRRPPPPEET